jgi:hypothetical protein
MSSLHNTSHQYRGLRFDLGIPRKSKRMTKPDDANNRETVGKDRAGATEFLGHPGMRQPGLFERAPQRLFSSAHRARTDRLRIGKIGANARRRFGDDSLSLSAAISFVFPCSAFSVPDTREALPAAARDRIVPLFTNGLHCQAK